MQFHLSIRPLSAVHNLWRKQHLRVGFLHHTRFEYDIRRGIYDAVEPIREMEKLLKHPDVENGMTTAPVPAKPEVEAPAKPAPEPAKEPDTEKAPEPVKEPETTAPAKSEPAKKPATKKAPAKKSTATKKASNK